MPRGPEAGAPRARLVEPGHDQLLAADAAPPRHAASTRSRPFFTGFAPYVIAVMSRSPTGPEASTGTGTTTASPCGEGASASPPSLHGTQQRRVAEPALLHRPLPHAVAPGAVAGRRGVEADRARSRRQQGGRGRRVEHRSRPVLVDRVRRRRPRRPRPRELEQRVRPPLARPLGGGHDHLRPRPPERRGQLLVRRPQPFGPAQRHQEDVGPHGCARNEPPNPGVRTSSIGRSGEVFST